MVKHMKERWVKGEHGVNMYYGRNYVYAYSKVIDRWMLMVSVKTGEIRYTMRIKNPAVAKQIVKLLER